MTNFADHLTVLDGAVRDHVCDDATYVPVSGSSVPGHRVILEVPAEEQAIQDARIVLAAPTIEVEVAACPSLKRGDAFDVGDNRWRLAEAPRKPGDGRWWRAAVEKVAQS